MNEDRVVGTARNVGGQLEEGFGRVTGDVKSQVEGKIKQATGAAQIFTGRRATRPAMRQRPCRSAPLRWKKRCATRSRTAPTPRSRSHWRSAGSSAA